MTDFQWSEALQLGVNAMDRDHRRIIDYMNDLAKAVEGRAPRASIDAAFSKLNDFTSKHFSDEERYMESIGYERLQTHKAIHRKLLDELDGHYQHCKKTGEVGDQVFRFLTFWLKSHICGIDKQYAALALAS